MTMTTIEQMSPAHPVDFGLSEKDVNIMAALAQGYPQESIARHAGYSMRTIRRRINRICRRLGVSTSIEAVVFMVRKGWI
jgi:DNA-binding NarL/FixJ family response regulator